MREVENDVNDAVSNEQKPDGAGGKVRGRIARQMPVLFAAYLFIASLILIVLLCNEFIFYIDHIVVWFVLNVVIVIAFMSVCFASDRSQSKESGIIVQLLPFLAGVYILSIGLIAETSGGIFLGLHAAICFFCCFALAFALGKRTVLRVVMGILNGIFAALFLLVMYFVLIFSQVGVNTVVDTIPSPEGAHTAVMIRSDQGALGLDNWIYVEHNHLKCNILMGRFIKRERIHDEDLEVFSGMEIVWEDEQTLRIDGEVYEIQ